MRMNTLAPKWSGFTDRKTFVPGFLCALLLGLCIAAFVAVPLSAQTPNEALFSAVEVNDITAVEAAIAAGADLGMKNAKGMTPADVAVDLGHFRIAHLLLSKRTTKPGATPAPRVTDNIKQALIKPKARVSGPATQKAPDPRLSDLMPPRKPENAAAPSPEAPMPTTAPASPAAPIPADQMPAPAKAAPPEIRPDDQLAKSTPTPMPAKAPQQSARAEEPGFFGNLWDGVKNVVTIGGLLGGDQTKLNEKDRRLTSKEGESLSSPADRFSSKSAIDETGAAPSDSAAGRMVDRMKDMVGSDKTAENAFGLPQGPVVPPLPIDSKGLTAPPGMVTVETAERTPALAPPSLEAPGLAAPGLAAPGLAAPGLEVPGLAAPQLPAAKSKSPAPGRTRTASPAPGIEVPGLPGLAIPGLPNGPAPPDPEVPGLPSGMDIPGLAAPSGQVPSGEIPGIIPPPSLGDNSMPAIPPGLEALPGSQQMRRPGGLVEPKDPTALPPPITGSIQDQINRIDKILNRSPDQNSERYLTPRAVGTGERNRQPTATAPLTAPEKAPVQRGAKPDPMLEIPKGLEGRQVRPVPPPPVEQARDPAEILRRARESEAVLKEREIHNQKPGKNDVNTPRKLAPSGHQLQAPDKAITAREQPSDRLLQRLSDLGNSRENDEDIHGLPIVRPSIDGRLPPIRDVLVSEIPEDKKTDTDFKISKLARFFRGDQEEEAGMKAPKPVINREALPRVIDNMMPENDPARSRIVDDKLLDLQGVEIRPPEPGAQPGATPTRDTELNKNFVDRLATILGPSKKQLPFSNDQPAEPGKIGLKDLNVPKDQMVKPALPAIPDPWTMTVEKKNAQGESQTLGVTAINPVDGSEVRTEKGVVSQMVGRIRKLLNGPKDEGKGPNVEALDENDRQSAAEKLLSEALRDGAPTALPDQSQWPVTEVEPMNAPDGIPPAPRPGVLTRTSLEDVVLSMGESVTLENTLPPQQDGIDPLNSCVKKNHGTTLFCVEPVDWPQELRPAFVVPTILYTGPMAITRYDQGSPTRFHSLFDSEKFEQVIAYYQARYGEPTEIWKRSIAPLAKPRMDNPTVTWRSRDKRTNVISVLEIRKFDDSRGGFPDISRGAVMLYHYNAPSIFPQVSSHELMRLRRSTR